MTSCSNKNRTCLFALWDPRAAGQVRFTILPSTIWYLSALRNSGFVVHAALSGVDRLDPGDERVLAGLGVRWHLRRNDGHDFGAWQHLLRLGCADAADTVLLANDSVFGPLRPLPPIVEQMQALPLDVWGMVESREMRWHLQSWFLCFSAAGFAAPAIQRVMQQPFDRMTRNEIVLHGELGLGAALQAEGLRWDARWRVPDRRLRRLVPGNPMHLDYLSVVRSGRVPFLKADLLRNNPAAIGWADRWRTLFALPEADGGLPLALVRQALDARPGAPPPRQAAAMRLLYALISADRPDAARALLRRPSPRR